MADLANCQSCGKLFVRTNSPYCPDCLKKQDKKFDVVYRYITSRDHRMATVTEVHQATEVSTEMIYQWIREGRLKTSVFPNLGYPCQSCGKLITAGVICEECQTRIRTEIRQDNLEKEVLKKDLDKRTYHTHHPHHI